MSQGSPSSSSSPPPSPAAEPSPEKEEPPAAPPAGTRTRPSRACTLRAAAARFYSPPATVRRTTKKKDQQRRRREESISPSPSPSSSPSRPLQQCSKIVTSLVEPPPPSQLPRWNLRSMWELASILNFLHLFRPFLNISVEFSAEEFETALLNPNDTLAHIHMPLLKAIPPITRMALSRDTWITVLCRKLKDWWHWVAEGDLPIVASHGAEIEVYKSFDPALRVVILKALCDIRVEQEDIRNYIDNSLKHGVKLSTFRKERIGGDSHGTSFWYEDDEIIGHRLYREIRKTEVVQVKKGKPRGSQILSSTTYQWETVATNFDEFQDVSEKLFSSQNRMEASVGKKLKIDMLPEIEKVHKRKERLMKKQHRQALLLDNYVGVDGLAPGRSLRDRKPVTYTFDDYDRSINEAIKITKRNQSSPEPLPRREFLPRRERGPKHESLTNGKWSGPSHASEHLNFSPPSPKSPDFDDMEEENQTDALDRSNRRRQRPKRYSEKEFVEAVSDNDPNFDSDDDIVGEAVYDEEYIRKRNQRRKVSGSSASEGDEEYHWDDDNVADEEDEEDSLSISEDSDKPSKFKQKPGRSRRGTKLRSVDGIQSSLRRSKRATRNRINYRAYEASESETDFIKPEKSNASDDISDPRKRATRNRKNYEVSESETEFIKPGKSNASSDDVSDPSQNGEFMMESEDSDGNGDEDQEMKAEEPLSHQAVVENDYSAVGESEQNQNLDQQPPEKSSSLPAQEEIEGTAKRRFLDLNELAPSSGFDDVPNTTTKDDSNED